MSDFYTRHNLSGRLSPETIPFTWKVQKEHQYQPYKNSFKNFRVSRVLTKHSNETCTVRRFCQIQRSIEDNIHILYLKKMTWMTSQIGEGRWKETYVVKEETIIFVVRGPWSWKKTINPNTSPLCRLDPSCTFARLYLFIHFRYISM